MNLDEQAKKNYLNEFDSGETLRIIYIFLSKV